MRWGLFQMAEYVNLIVLSALVVTLFFGGWHVPWSALDARADLVPPQAAFFLYLFIWIRASLPRLRYDQLMRFGWKVLLPVATINALVTAFFVVLIVTPDAAAVRHLQGLRASRSGSCSASR